MMVATREKIGLSATVDRARLAWATAIAAAAGGKSKVLDLTQYVRLEVRDGRLLVEGSDLTSGSVRLSIPAPLSEDGATLVNGALLASAAATFGGDTLTLSLTGTTLQLKGAGRLARLATRDAEDFPPFPDEAGEPLGVVDGAALRAALGRVTWAVARETSRLILTGVSCRIAPRDTVSGLDGRLELAATDGFSLAVDALPVENGPADGWVGVLDGAALRALAAGDFPDGAYTLTRDGARVRLDGPDMTVIVMAVAGNYPNYQALIPPATADAVTVPTAELLDLLARARLFAQGGQVISDAAGKTLHSPGSLRLRTAAGALESLAMSEVNAIEDRLEADTSGLANAWRTALDLGRLGAALKAAGAETVTIQPGGDPPKTDSPVRLSTEDGWRAVIMPLFLADPEGWAEGCSK